ncbi:MAG: septum formation initiator family protein [Eubacterium sp.]|nr:septum formation initiator family protein [Eubacterium sp.]
MAKSTRKKKKKLNIGRFILSLIVVSLLIGCGFSIKKIIQLHLEKSRLQETQKVLESHRDDLTAELKNVNELDYIEEQARKQLKMIKPGEVLYVLDDEKQAGKDNAGEEKK